MSEAIGPEWVEQRHEDAGIDAHSLSELALAHRAVVGQQAEKLELSQLEAVGVVRGAPLLDRAVRAAD